MRFRRRLKKPNWEVSAELIIEPTYPHSEGLIVNILEDRLTSGFVAGAASFVVPTIWNHVSKLLLSLSHLTFSDCMSVFIFGRFSRNVYEYIFATLGTVVWHGFLGIVFTYLLLLIKQRNLVFKGWLFGVGIWFFAYAITLLFQLPEFAEIPLGTAASNLLSASLQGIGLGYMFIFLDKKRLDKGLFQR